jgi:phage shock protein PspC (stress-responsive transcriptional regulator)
LVARGGEPVISVAAAPAHARTTAWLPGKSGPVGDDGGMDPQIVKIIAVVLIVCLIGATFVGVLFF